MDIEQFINTAHSTSMGDFMTTLVDILEYPSVVLLFAILLELILPLGDKYRFRSFAPVFASMARKVNRPENSLGQRVFASVFLPFLILAMVFICVELLRFVLISDVILTLLVMPVLLESKCIIRHIQDVRRSLCEDGKEKAKQVLQVKMLRDCTRLSNMGICKALAEKAAMGMFATWFSPVVWYIILGVEGAVLMQSVTVMNRAFSIKRKSTEDFGVFTNRLEHALMIPPLLCLIVMMMFSFSFGRILGYLINHSKNYHEVVSGSVLDMMGAYANCAMGGPRYYKGRIYRFPKLGSTLEPTEKSAIKICNKIRMCGIIFVCISVSIGVFHII